MDGAGIRHLTIQDAHECKLRPRGALRIAVEAQPLADWLDRLQHEASLFAAYQLVDSHPRATSPSRLVTAG
jgi:hypothetical protein